MQTLDDVRKLGHAESGLFPCEPARRQGLFRCQDGLVGVVEPAPRPLHLITGASKPPLQLGASRRSWGALEILACPTHLCGGAETPDCSPGEKAPRSFLC